MLLETSLTEVSFSKLVIDLYSQGGFYIAGIFLELMHLYYVIVFF